MMAAEVAKEHVSVIAKAFDGDSGYHKFTEDEYKNVIEQLDKGVDVDFYNLICSRHAYNYIYNSQCCSIMLAVKLFKSYSLLQS